MARELIDCEEEKKSEKRASGKHHSGPAKPVAEIAPKRPGLRGSWSVRHRGNYLQAARKVTSKQPRDCRSQKQDRHRVGSAKAAVHRCTAKALRAKFGAIIF